VDWEAILSRAPEPFVASVSRWLYPPAARAPPPAAAAADSAPAAADGAPAALDGAAAAGDAAPAAGAGAPAAGAARGGGAPAAGDPVAGLDVGALPPVREVLATSRQRLEALNGPGMARI